MVHFGDSTAAVTGSFSWPRQPGKYCQAAWHHHYFQYYYYYYCYMSKLCSTVLPPRVTSIYAEHLDTQHWVVSSTNAALPVCPVTTRPSWNWEFTVWGKRIFTCIKLGSVSSFTSSFKLRDATPITLRLCFISFCLFPFNVFSTRGGWGRLYEDVRGAWIQDQSVANKPQWREQTVFLSICFANLSTL